MDPLTACRRAEGAFVSVLAKVGPDQAGAPDAAHGVVGP